MVNRDTTNRRITRHEAHVAESTNIKLALVRLGTWLHGNETCVDRHESCGPWSKLGECKNNPTWMRAHCPVSCKVVSGCTASSPKILVEDVSTETWTSVKAVVGDLLLALRGDEVLFVREVDGPADVTVVAS